jgi:hypothetical protein
MNRTIFDRTFSEVKGISNVTDNINDDTSAKGTFITKKIVEHYLSVSSSHRDTVNYPLHYKYKLRLANEFKNVTKVTLVSVTIPNSSGILDEPLLALSIDELNCTKLLTSTNEKTVFSVFPIKTPEKTTGGYINPDLNVYVTKEFIVPIRLSSLTVSLLDIEGSLFDFGVPNGSTLKSLQHNFLLKIETEAF